MNLFLGADFHFDNANVIKHSNRPYETVEQMNEALVENWNKKVSTKDTTIIIGDFAWKNHGHWISALNGKKILVLGSHDKMAKRYLQCFTDVKMIYYFTIKDRPFVASHCCQRIWEKCHYGSVHVHGHSHGRLKTYNLSFDMGVDCNNYQPVSSEELLSMVAKREEEMSSRGRIRIEDRQGKKVKIYYQDDLEFLSPGNGRTKGDH